MPPHLLTIRMDGIPTIIQHARNRRTRDRLILQALLEVGTISRRELVKSGTDNAYAR
jgi:hypothetical protein